MKREERRIYNGLRKMETAGLINVEVRHDYTAEARQAMHELLTVEKGLVAVRVCPSLTDYSPCTLYIPATTREQCDARKAQETMTETAVVETLPESVYTWNGRKKPGTDPDTDPDTDTKRAPYCIPDNALSSIYAMHGGKACLHMYENKRVVFEKVYSSFRGAKQAQAYYLKHGTPAKKAGYDIKKLFDIVNDAITTDRSAFHEPRDNSKLRGIPAFNLAPGRTCSPEACAHCLKDGCYAVKNACCHGYNLDENNCLRAWTENTALAFNHMRELEKALDAWLTENRPALFRIHSSGDFFSVEYARMWRRIAMRHAETRFLAFTKQFDVVRHVHFYKLDNFELVLSGWTGVNVPDDLRRHYRVAWCNDGTETHIPADAIHCPGDCNACRACWYLSRMKKDSYFDKH